MTVTITGTGSPASTVAILQSRVQLTVMIALRVSLVTQTVSPAKVSLRSQSRDNQGPARFGSRAIYIGRCMNVTTAVIPGFGEQRVSCGR